MYMDIVFMYVYIHTTCLSRAHGSQKRTFDLLELELETAVSFYVVGGNQTWVLQKSSQN